MFPTNAQRPSTVQSVRPATAAGANRCPALGVNHAQVASAARMAASADRPASWLASAAPKAGPAARTARAARSGRASGPAAPVARAASATSAKGSMSAVPVCAAAAAIVAVGESAPDRRVVSRTDHAASAADMACVRHVSSRSSSAASAPASPRPSASSWWGESGVVVVRAPSFLASETDVGPTPESRRMIDPRGEMSTRSADGVGRTTPMAATGWGNCHRSDRAPMRCPRCLVEPALPLSRHGFIGSDETGRPGQGAFALPWRRLAIESSGSARSGAVGPLPGHDVEPVSRCPIGALHLIAVVVFAASRD